ncbi:hypothetical protein FXV83_22170 [Bradyrhizobium hipponense]|uniref:Uncharacterized protein n=1 Tax=Bradyrhizobium hipponense TaxID=2605638 RepID=A0A5S4YJ82_9BRAD|nr:hypothetical protein [Bradyrhizobium hipponense]TYO64446.1 hypothetical protein FXV83_22170 [Bradyrhizobium hipponense]
MADPPAEANARTAYSFAALVFHARSDRALGLNLTCRAKVLGFVFTDALAGFAAITANLVVSFYLVKRGFENVARIVKR